MVEPPLVALATAMGAFVAPAQQQWTSAHAVPRPNAEVLLCEHLADRRIVGLTARPTDLSFETWEWNGARWHQRHPERSMPWCQAPALAYDVARRRIVAFGGVGPSYRYLDTTWEWDGVTWSQRLPATSPPARYVAGLAYDSARRRSVLYGGSDAGGLRNDLWEWDGSTWQQRTPGGAAPPAANPMMAYDEARGVTVLCPHDLTAPRLEVYEYDGNQWTHPVPAVRPIGINGARIAWDPHRARTVLYSGYEGFLPTTPSTDFLEWDGTQWQRTTPAVPLPFRTGIGFAYDTRMGRFVLHGGGVSADTWTYDPQTTVWTQTPQIAPYDVQAAACDWSGRFLVTSFRDTFLWDRGTRQFTQLASTSAPPAMAKLGMAFDLARQEVVLLGAAPTGTQTWIWSVQTGQWRQELGISPPYAVGGALAYDVVRGRTVFFGGILGWPQSPVYTNDTWEWDGSAWSRITPPQSPSARAFSAMAFDFQNNGLVLFGGQASGVLDDTWVWNGITWTPLAPLNQRPAPRAYHALVTRANGVDLIGGGDVAGPAFADSWHLQGSQWTPLPTSGLPALAQLVVASNPAADEVVVFGGADPIHWPTSGVWLTGASPATVTPFGGGCGAGGSTGLEASAEPVLGTTLSLTASGLGAQQPLVFAFGLAARALELPASCRSLVAPVATVFASTTSNGSASLSLAIPAVVTFVGLDLYSEAAALDPGTIWAMTPALRLTVGD
ncbi:MAG: hypothetical protein KDE27_07135 [Planctomycetes bacterium]|nr:hypothetical protein [Planctomycetota bacterium]